MAEANNPRAVPVIAVEGRITIALYPQTFVKALSKWLKKLTRGRTGVHATTSWSLAGVDITTI